MRHVNSEKSSSTFVLYVQERKGSVPSNTSFNMTLSLSIQV